MNNETENEILLFATTWIDLEAIMLSEGSEMEKGRYILASFMLWNLKEKTKRTDFQIQKNKWLHFQSNIQKNKNLT